MANEAAERVSIAVGPQLSQMDMLSVAVMGLQEKLAEVVDISVGEVWSSLVISPRM